MRASSTARTRASWTAEDIRATYTTGKRAGCTAEGNGDNTDEGKGGLHRRGKGREALPRGGAQPRIRARCTAEDTDGTIEDQGDTTVDKGMGGRVVRT